LVREMPWPKKKTSLRRGSLDRGGRGAVRGPLSLRRGGRVFTGEKGGEGMVPGEKIFLGEGNPYVFGKGKGVPS